jgi:C1A family cysteine protease
MAPLVSVTPRNVDLRAQGPVIWDQLDVGSCVAEGTLRAVNHAQRRQGEPVLSPSSPFTYYAGRLMNGWQSQDSGLFIRDGAKAVNRYGVAPYDTWTRHERFDVKPAQRAWDAARNELVVAYHRVLYPEQIHVALQSGLPVVFGMTLYESFEDGGVNGRLPVPAPSEQPIGGHCMAVEGYRAGTDDFIVPNSWGTSWGDHGYCYIPAQMFDYMTGPLMNDLWVIDLTDKD